MTMMEKFLFVLGFATFGQSQLLVDLNNNDNPCDTGTIKATWLSEPPFTLNHSLHGMDQSPRGIVPNIVQQIFDNCYGFLVDIEMKNARRNEEEMLQDMEANKSDIAFPIIVPSTATQYGRYRFLSLMTHPGSVFLANKRNADATKVVLEAVMKSWPLLVVTLLLTAIAGVIVWVADTYQNLEEFPRPFLLGSWEGIWWSFVSMTTVGYGDKVPKSVVARLFAVVWILFGLVIMAIFMASITTALTAASIEPDTSLENKKVAVLGNSSVEFQYALQEGADTFVFDDIHNMVDAVNEEALDGIIMNRYSATYYMRKHQESSLFVVKRLQHEFNMGFILTNRRKDCFQMFSECAQRSYESMILPQVKSLAAKYEHSTELKKDTNKKTFNLFDSDSQRLHTAIYILLGILAEILILGTLIERLLMLRKRQQEQVRGGNESDEKKTWRRNLDAARALLVQMHNNLEEMERRMVSADNETYRA